MTGMREQIAQAHFERDKANNLQGLATLNGGRAQRKWSPEQRAEYRAMERMTWPMIEQRDRDGYLATADVALGALAEGPTDGMVEKAWHVGNKKGDGTILRAHPVDEFEAMIRAAQDGK